MMTSLNAADVYGFDLAKLQSLADGIGPTYEDLSVPVRREELPTRTSSLTLASAAGMLLAKK